MSRPPKKSTPTPKSRTQLKNVALFKDEDEPTRQSRATQTLRLEQIVTSPSQPRRYFDPDKLELLTQSVKQHGILEPLLVRSRSDNKYELVAGERRYLAATAAGLAEVPVVVKELTDTEALQLALIENLQREDLNPVEETEGILQLIALRENLAVDEVISRLYRMYNEVKGNVNSSNPNVRVNEFDNSVKVIFDSLLSLNWLSFVKNKLPLLKLPEDVLSALRGGQIEYTKAKAIARIKDEQQRKNLIEEAVAENLSLVQIKEKIAALSTDETSSSSPSTQIKTITRRLNQSKLWSKNPKKWKQVQNWLKKIETLLEET